MLDIYLEAKNLTSLSEFLIAIPLLHKKYYKKQDFEVSKLVSFILKRMKDLL